MLHVTSVRHWLQGRADADFKFADLDCFAISTLTPVLTTSKSSLHAEGDDVGEDDAVGEDDGVGEALAQRR